MADSVSQRIEHLAAQLDGLEAAAEGLESDPAVGVSIRRIARALESAAQSVALHEIAAGAKAIQKASDGQLSASVANFLARVEDIRHASPADELCILIVEDNKTVAAATRAYLEAPGRRLLVAESADEAQSVMASDDIDLVIMDLFLPDRDGRDVLVQMRERAATTTIPVIVLSSIAGEVARAECLAVGADEFMRKPADPRLLRSAVSRLLKRGKQRRNEVRDGLTGLPNRAGIITEFEEQRRRTGDDGTPLTVAVLTLDSLAEVTMKMGRDAGDRFLLEVCAAVHHAIGKGTALGRWETAQLLAVLPGQTAEDAQRVLETTARTLANDDTLAEYRKAGIAISLSGGVTQVEGAQELRDVVSAAEKWLYSGRTEADQSVHTDADVPERETQRILLVEDDRVTATLIQHRLVRDGHEVVDFLDGARAFKWAEAEEFDLAILDVKVPGMDGFELLSKIRAIPRLAKIPIIMLTGMGSEADVIRGLDLGADDYMLKPFSPSELLARVRRLLHAGAGGDESESVAPPSSSEEART